MSPSSRIGFAPLATIDVGNTLGEGVVWQAQGSAFLWTDIEGRSLHRLEWPGLRHSRFDLPYRLCSFAITRDETEIVAAFEMGIALYDFTDGSIEWLARPELPVGVRFNDGRCDRTGRFVVGTMVEDHDTTAPSASGTLARLEPSGTLTTLLTGISISNALCWSPDGAKMYHADSPTGQLRAYDYPSVKPTGVGLSRYDGGMVPDGACVDAEGRIWVAAWGGSAVIVHSPDGAILDRIPVPARQPTCVAFGGSDLDILSVTSATQGIAPQDRQKDGALHLFRVEARGILEVTADYR